MNNCIQAPLCSWLIEPMEKEVEAAIGRLRRAADVRQVAVMPDVHLATEVCVGVVMGTSRLLYPQAVGGDIGCGMLAVGFDAEASAMDAATAGRVLALLRQRIPTLRRHRRWAIGMPMELREPTLSHGQLEAVRREEGCLQFGTVGSGNHFVELQADEEGRLWLMIHSGSRAMGQAIRDHHLANAEQMGNGWKALEAESPAGLAYLQDLNWARRYAAENRVAMARIVAEILHEELRASADWNRLVAADHNHVAREAHDRVEMWVHRKGAMAAGAGVMGAVPGSMGTASFHVEGKGCAKALCSSAHGAGRRLSRNAARKAIARRELHRQMEGVWYDYRQAGDLIEEAPSAYKDVRAVMRAQKELVKVVRVLKPLLNFKGR